MRLITVILSVGAAWSGVGAQVYVNPLLGNINIHDPSAIVKEGATYYVYYTGSLIPIKPPPTEKREQGRHFHCKPRLALNLRARQ